MNPLLAAGLVLAVLTVSSLLRGWRTFKRIQDDLRGPMRQHERFTKALSQDQRP